MRTATTQLNVKHGSNHPDGPDTGKDKKLLDACLAEYNPLGQEVLQRLQWYYGSFNYMLILLGAALAAIDGIIEKVSTRELALFVVVLL